MAQKERIFTRDFTIDAVISLCCSLNYFTLLINITGYASFAFGADPAAGGTAAGIYVIGGLLSRVLIGKYVELVGRKKMLIAGLLLAVVMSASYFFVTSMAMVELLLQHWYEPPPARRLFVSTLVQQTLSVVASIPRTTAKALYELLCKTGPFSMVTPGIYALILKA